MKRRFLANSVSGVINTLVSVVFVAITIPVFVDRMGIVAYGIFTLISLVNIINIIGNFGLTTSLIKYLSEQGRSKESNNDIQLTMLFITGASTVLSTIVFSFEISVVRDVLGIGADRTTLDVIVCFRYLLLSNIFNILMQTCFGVFDSLQKIYISNAIQLAFNLASRGGMLIMLLWRPSLASLGFVYCLSSLLAVVVAAGAVFLVWGNFLEHMSFRDYRKGVKKHFRYSISLYVTTMLGIAYEAVTKIVINHFIGTTEVGLFDIAMRIKSVLWSIGDRILYPILPYIASLGDANARTVVMEVEEKLTYVVIPFIVTFMFIADALITVWIGPQRNAYLASAVISIVSVNMLALTVVPTYQYFTVKNHQRKNLMMQATNVIVNFSLFFPLYGYFGFYAIVFSFSSAIGCSFLLAYFYKFSLKIASVQQVKKHARIISIVAVLACTDTLAVILLTSPLVVLVSVPIMNIFATVLLYRFLRFFSIEDIERYFGHNASVKRYAYTLLIAK
ncbi:MAG: oligosaccharide flippase family protein [Bacteroidota bacterium]